MKNLLLIFFDIFNFKKDFPFYYTIKICHKYLINFYIHCKKIYNSVTSFIIYILYYLIFNFLFLNQVLFPIGFIGNQNVENETKESLFDVH